MDLINLTQRTKQSFKAWLARFDYHLLLPNFLFKTTDKGWPNWIKLILIYVLVKASHHGSSDLINLLFKVKGKVLPGCYYLFDIVIGASEPGWKNWYLIYIELTHLLQKNNLLYLTELI